VFRSIVLTGISFFLILAPYSAVGFAVAVPSLWKSFCGWKTQKIELTDLVLKFPANTSATGVNAAFRNFTKLRWSKMRKN
jgi:hypothetical protein